MTTAFLLLSLMLGAPAESASPFWIWSHADREAHPTAALRGEVEIHNGLRRAQLTAVADYCRAAFFLNGVEVARREPYEAAFRLDVTEHLQRGGNALVVTARRVEGPAAVMLRLELEYEDGRRTTFVSNESWQAADFNDQALAPPAELQAAWRPAAVLGHVARFPWGQSSDAIAIRAADNYEQWKQALDAPAGSDPQSFETLPGFDVRLIRSASATEDSWVSLACDEQGRWIIAKEKKGLLRLTPPKTAGGEAKVETINHSLAECRGLVFAYGALYAMANNDKTLYRLRDTNGDDRFDEVQGLVTFAGGVGHGRNQLVLGPDGLIYGVFGDSVIEPQVTSLPPRLPHPTRREQAATGFVARTDREGRRWRILSRGLRNPYGLDFNTYGDLFTYDADAEYDMGAPWYRPTRIVHLVPGGDFGWRSVTQQWPPYFPDRPDMPPTALDIGKGAPTAVAFGSKSHFPPPYRDALFALDWAYGRILAVHMTPRGASYAAAAETFLRGRPLNVTDVEFGPDGAMYFITGGRGTRSGLYRVAYVGPARAKPAASPQQLASETHAASARQTRRKLESFLGRPTPKAVETAWPYLSHSDPSIRHAARVVVETQPVAEWRERALQESQRDAALAAWMALARVGSKDDRPAILDRLGTLDLTACTGRQKLEALFLYDRCLPEDEPLPPDIHKAAQQALDPLYPDASPQVNQHLSLLLARLTPPSFVARTLHLLDTADDQQQRLHYLFVLRNIKTGWTPELRATYFAHLGRMSDFIGGEGMPTFRRLIEDEAMASLSPEEQAQYAQRVVGDLLGLSDNDLIEPNRPVVRQWTLDDFAVSSLDLSQGRDLERGRHMFSVARCIVCHRVGREGGVSGPDLTSVARRFTPRDILTSILEPSRVIDEKYCNEAFELIDGRIVVGRVAPGDYRSPTLRIIPDLLRPEKTVTVAKTEIEQHYPSPLSPMPTGLLDTLTREEILDLLAFLVSASQDNE